MSATTEAPIPHPKAEHGTTLVRAVHSDLARRQAFAGAAAFAKASLALLVFSVSLVHAGPLMRALLSIIAGFVRASVLLSFGLVDIPIPSPSIRDDRGRLGRERPYNTFSLRLARSCGRLVDVPIPEAFRVLDEALRKA